MKMELPDHPEKYMSWSRLERKFLEPYFEQITKLKDEINRLKKENEVLRSK